jgi:Nucleotide-diphospho-sugar transferase
MTPSGQAELPASLRHELTRAVDGAPAGAEALPVIFATDNFAPLLRNWLRHAEAAGVTRTLVIAMDQALHDRLGQAGLTAVRHSFDGTLGDLWYQRTLVFEWLAEHGVDFIHSDADAVWLRDPRPLCFADGGFDLVFSQGINYPAETWRSWGFVLCCGLFAVRANPATAAFFAAVRTMTAKVGDDQVVINALLQQSGMSWRGAGLDSYELTNRHGQAFTCHRQVLPGFSDQFGLHVGLLPHHRVPRLPIAGIDALVRHPVGPAGDPIAKLKAAGCWME